jgi:hypothetical protein
VIEEVLQLKISQEYFQHLRRRLHRAPQRDRSALLQTKSTQIMGRAFGADDIELVSCRHNNTPSAWMMMPLEIKRRSRPGTLLESSAGSILESAEARPQS